ncbi:Protein Wnt-6 [Nibea albiflora]|uniref:Protein Wnt-6 n=1 Tax=Nibea albiflora TaxID=240163 RepID=A0ACB7EFG5_NIBAL|nr:Protein Wnt-6 [Nibea albiflora]
MMWSLVMKSQNSLWTPKGEEARATSGHLLNLHNNEAGRLAVKLYMRTECKCHGLSGSCTLRTCWKKMPHFREVGDRLLERFNGASKVMGGNDGKTLIPVGQNIKPPDKQDLIYSDESPDFCLANRKLVHWDTGAHMQQHSHGHQWL